MSIYLRKKKLYSVKRDVVVTNVNLKSFPLFDSERWRGKWQRDENKD